MSEKIFITHIVKDDGLYEGPRIFAKSFKEAALQAERLGVILVGRLMFEG